MLSQFEEAYLGKTDFHLTEAGGHFHLYTWLKEAVGDLCVISPEFPTGNGQVDLHIRVKKQQGIIEVKRKSKALEMQRD